MAADNRKPRDRAADTERLAAQIYTALVTGGRAGAKTQAAHAADALAAAREFYRAADDTPEAPAASQPKG